MSRRVHLVIPAAGLGSRFMDVGINTPKPLIEVFDIPMLFWVISNFSLCAQDKIWVIGQTKHQLKSKLNLWLGNLLTEINFIEIDGVTEGPAKTVALALEAIPDSEGVIVANSDQFVKHNLAGFIGGVRNGIAPASIVTMEATSNAWSYIGRNDLQQIERIVEKEEISNEATVGIYGWSECRYLRNSFNHMFKSNIKTNGEFYVAPSFNHLIQNKFEISTFHVGKHGKTVHGLGTPADLERFHADSSNLLIAESLQRNRSSQSANS